MNNYRAGALFRQPQPIVHDSRAFVDNQPVSVNRAVWGRDAPGMADDRINRRRIAETMYFDGPETHAAHPAHYGELNFPVDERTVVHGTHPKSLGHYGLGEKYE